MVPESLTVCLSTAVFLHQCAVSYFQVKCAANLFVFIFTILLGEKKAFMMQ